MTLKQRIMALKEQGYRVNEIATKLGCSHSVVSYHSTPGGKETHYKRTKERSNGILIRLKLEHGGKCQICGFLGYLPALHFHHVKPKEKRFSVSRAAGRSYEKLKEEADKCVLVCGNCHAMIHGKVIPCPSENSLRSHPRKPTRKSAPRRGDTGQAPVRRGRSRKA